MISMKITIKKLVESQVEERFLRKKEKKRRKKRNEKTITWTLWNLRPGFPKENTRSWGRISTMQVSYISSYSSFPGSSSILFLAKMVNTIKRKAGLITKNRIEWVLRNSDTQKIAILIDWSMNNVHSSCMSVQRNPRPSFNFNQINKCFLFRIILGVKRKRKRKRRDLDN